MLSKFLLWVGIILIVISLSSCSVGFLGIRGDFLILSKEEIDGFVSTGVCFFMIGVGYVIVGAILKSSK